MNQQEVKEALLNDIEDAQAIQILDEDEWSYLFRATFMDGRDQKGICYKEGLDTPGGPMWELGDEPTNEMDYEVKDAFEEAQLKLGEAIEAVHHLAAVCQNTGAGESGMAHSRINAYLLPHLESWMNDEGQIGSFPSLYNELTKEGEDVS